MAHHGMQEIRGRTAMLFRQLPNPLPSNRFGRMFPHLPDPYFDPTMLMALGKLGGPMDGGMQDQLSSTIPLGMAFLGQFIDHDITLDTTSSLDRKNDPNAIENFRTPTLDLDCIYGNGPEASSFLYDVDGVKLLTAEDGTAAILDPRTDNEREQEVRLRENDLMRTGVNKAIIGDPRNDENRIISQLQLAFIKFHNRMVDSMSSRLHGKELFEAAREAVLKYYHWVILHEFLPIMVGKPLVDRIMYKGRRFYKPVRPYIPVEFSAAAYRFGHSIIPQKLSVQLDQRVPFDLFSDELGAAFSPVSNENQIVDWRTMFNYKRRISLPFSPSIYSQETFPQKANKLDTKLASILLDLPFIPAGDESSLATRNLLRGNAFGLPSGEQVANEMKVSREEIIRVEEHIHAQTEGIDFSNGIPLWYYILAEAECIGRKDATGNKPGEGLGTVGGTIVAETLIGLIELNTNSFMAKTRNWFPRVHANFSYTMADLLDIWESA